MPTPLMDLKGLSSPSHISEDACFRNEGQVPSCKSAALPDQYGTAGGKAYASPPLQKFGAVDSQTAKYVDHTEPFLLQDQERGLSLDQHALQNGNDLAGGQSLAFLRSLDHNSGSISSLNALQASFYAQSNTVNTVRPQYENSLFSSSLPELFSRKLKLSSNNALFDHSVRNVAPGLEEEDKFASLKEIEAQTIGNLLPDDDDLLSGVTEGLDFAAQPTSDDAEELDFFSNVGGMDLGESETSAKQKYIKSGSNGSIAGEHSSGRSPSRTLFVRNIISDTEDSELRTLFEQYGDVCRLYTACKHRGFIVVSYYDIRAARKAMEYLQNRLIMGRKLDIHYSNSNDNPSQRDISQGTLIASNVDHGISNDELHHIFGVYGDIKEIRNIPYRNHQRSIEFYDNRHAEAAFHALDRSGIAGKQIKVEPIHPGGMKDLLQSAPELKQDEQILFMQQSSPSNHSAPGFPGRSSLGMGNGSAVGMQSSMQIPFMQSALHHGISSSVPNGLPSLLRVESLGKQSGLPESGHLQGQMKFDIREPTNLHPHSLPDYQDGLVHGNHCNSPTLMGTNFNPRPPETIDGRQLQRVDSNGHSLDQVFGSAGSGSSPLLGHRYMWGSNSYRSQPPSMIWPNSPSFVNGIHTSHPSARLQGLPGAPPQLRNSVLPTHAQNHHIGSAPTVNPTIWERQQQSYAVGSPETSILHPGSLGTMRISKNSLHSMELVPHNIFPNVNGNCMELPVPPSKVVGLQSPHHRGMMFPGRGPMMPSVGSFDPPNERIRSRRNEGGSNQADKKQYELDIERIIRGEDNRTTLMIKNIPNKYTSKMLLAAIDEHHRGTYDFIYLPIDFKNKCNVGYAFINMTGPSQIVPFYKAFNGKKWEKFNSEKVASLAYARIQGKAALIAHFQNSSLMNEDKRCRPILFNTEGPNAGDQVPFPMGVNVRSRPGKVRSSFLEDNHQGSPPSSATGGGDYSSGGDALAGPTKDRD
ncbi:protein MEI2-like 4 isoform X1 [Punica granatum]|uniref:Protein MEI2-like 4 isoform X1 n=1 Tax=Punica granatum TaxID=22663 RepID=A0A6P8CSG2_PUNGR|nr:protein MEI2-like 4 isoform X1 [Punica granatum]